VVSLPLSPNTEAMQDPLSLPVNGKHFRVEQIRNHAPDVAAMALVEASHCLHLDRAGYLHLLSSLHRNLTFTLCTLGAASASAASDSALASTGEEAL
jgi:alpha-1,4-galacturonosyltransferase